MATGKVKAGRYKRRRRREFLHFMNDLVADYPEQEIHVILDNLNGRPAVQTHKPKHDRWLARHPNVLSRFTPTYAGWLNQIECWFSILSRSALKGASFTSPHQVRRAIDAFIQVYSETAAPFEWRKSKVFPGTLKRYYAELLN